MMRVLKKASALVLASCMIFSLTACSGLGSKSESSGDNGSASNAETTAKETKAPVIKDLKDARVGVSLSRFDDNFKVSCSEEIKRYLTEDMGCNRDNITVQNASGLQETQMNQIRNFIVTEIDLVIVDLVRSDAAPQVTDLCRDAGLPVVYINQAPAQEEIDRWKSESIRASYIGSDISQAGTYQGELVASLENRGDVNGDGTVSYIMLKSASDSSEQGEAASAVKALTDAGIQTAEVVSQEGKSAESSQQIVSDALAQPEAAIDVIFCGNDAMAMGALQAVEAAGKVAGQDIYVVGMNAAGDSVQKVVDGAMIGTVFNDYVSLAQMAVDNGAKLLNGKTLDSAVGNVGCEKVTQANASDVLGKLQ